MRKYNIDESLEDLKNLRKKVKNHRYKTRLQSLILTKENKFELCEDLASHLGIGLRSLMRWRKTYLETGLDGLLSIKSGGKRRSVITNEMHEALKEKLHDAYNPLMGYKDAVLWIEKKFGVKVKYITLYDYIRHNFNAKLKTPRKSHYKKNVQAIEAFKKNSKYLSTD